MAALATPISALAFSTLVWGTVATVVAILAYELYALVRIAPAVIRFARRL